jgi:hypothetical protein
MRCAEKRLQALRRHHLEALRKRQGLTLTKLPRLELLVVERILSEIGLGMSRWPTAGSVATLQACHDRLVGCSFWTLRLAACSSGASLNRRSFSWRWAGLVVGILADLPSIAFVD